MSAFSQLLTTMQGKEHVPTEENRRMVEMLAFSKSTQSDIAAALGINDKTLREHYEHELAAKKSAIKSNLVYTGLMAGTGGGDWTKADTGMTKFMIDRCDTIKDRASIQLAMSLAAALTSTVADIANSAIKGTN
jgi:hypothetical protein